ncbi:hypothetical protein V6N12_034322, partial [Hibiscus sabdariffa]
FADEYDFGPVNAIRDGLEEQLMHAIELNGDGFKTDVVGFHGKMHVEDHLAWKASLGNYLKWKPMVEARKVLFVNLKLKDTTLQSWKRDKASKAVAYL